MQERLCAVQEHLFVLQGSPSVVQEHLFVLHATPSFVQEPLFVLHTAPSFVQEPLFVLHTAPNAMQGHESAKAKTKYGITKRNSQSAGLLSYLAGLFN